MPTVEEYLARWSEHPAPPRDAATVELLVLRKGQGRHETPAAIELTPEHGILGDRWSEGDEPKLPCQVTLMNVEVARLVAGEQPLHMPGDNVLLDLELSEESLPVGTRIQLGTATLEVGSIPHTGCSRFAERFGKEALQWVNGRERRGLRLRGVNCQVIKPGKVALGDPVVVVRG